MKLYTTIYGSKLYGTDGPTSDTDYKTVFLPSIDILLMGGKLKNTNITTGDNNSSNGVEDVDHERIPLQVLLSDFINGQTYALEIVFSALDESTQEKTMYDCHFKEICETLVSRFLTSNMRSMIGYALGQASKYGIKGTRLDTLIKFRDTLANYPNSTKLSKLEFPEELLSNFLELGVYYDRSKTSKKCIRVLGKIFPLDITISEAKFRVESTINRYGSRAKSAKQCNGKDWKAIAHATRIMMNARDILSINKIVFPMSNDKVEHLLDIKNGLLEWDIVSNEIDELLETVDNLIITTNLKPVDDLKDAFDEWSLHTIKKMYGVV